MARQAAVVGFYRDKGKTKPITKSVAKLNQKKVIQNPHSFKTIGTNKSFPVSIRVNSRRQIVPVAELRKIVAEIAALAKQKVGAQTGKILVKITDDDEIAAEQETFYPTRTVVTVNAEYLTRSALPEGINNLYHEVLESFYMVRWRMKHGTQGKLDWSVQHRQARSAERPFWQRFVHPLITIKYDSREKAYYYQTGRSSSTHLHGIPTSWVPSGERV